MLLANLRSERCVRSRAQRVRCERPLWGDAREIGEDAIATLVMQEGHGLPEARIIVAAPALFDRSRAVNVRASRRCMRRCPDVAATMREWSAPYG